MLGEAPGIRGSGGGKLRTLFCLDKRHIFVSVCGTEELGSPGGPGEGERKRRKEEPARSESDAGTKVFLKLNLRSNNSHFRGEGGSVETQSPSLIVAPLA